MTRLTLALLAALPLAACSAPEIQNGADAQSGPAGEVRTVEGELQAAYKARDAAKIASFYAADADIVTAYLPPVRGADQEKASQAAFADPAFAMEFVNKRTEVAGGLAYTRGTYTVTYTNPGNGEPATQSGSYLTVFRRTAEGDWKIVQDIATPGPRPTPSSTATPGAAS